MNVAPARVLDLPGLRALEESFAAAERWSEGLWRDELDRAPHAGHVVVAHDRGSVVGAAAFQCVVDVADLNRIVVVPGHRRRGLATRLLSDGVGWARTRGAERMLLEVRHDNAAALAFYGTHGFRPIAERTDYYAPGAHAVVMELPLTPEGTAS